MTAASTWPRSPWRSTIPLERRSFLRATSLGLFGLVGAPILSRASLHQETESWLRGLSGKHRQYFDVAAHGDGAPLKRAENFLNVYGDAYGLHDADLDVIFGAHGTALPLVLGDDVWSRYDIGAHFNMHAPGTTQPATRNVFAGGEGAFSPSVATLQSRGVRFLACRQSVARLARELAPAHGGNAALVQEALLAGLLPGVTPVPAAIVAVNRAQEAGLTYVYIG